MKIGILQPGYLPWLGFFEQMYKSDIFVIYDDVQYDKNGWRNRNKIKTAKGAQWLTVPVSVHFQSHQLVKDVKVDNSIDWKKKHLFSIKQSYSKSIFFDKYIDIFENAYARHWDYIIDIDMHFIKQLADMLGIKDKNVVLSSSFNIKGSRMERLVGICKKYKADTFYEGSAGREYIEEGIFSKNGIKVEYQDYKHPEYTQLYGEFIPYLSIVDLLFNHGSESLSILTENISNGRK